MSIALVQKANVAASGSTSQSGAYGSNNTLGNLLVALVWTDSGQTLSSMTDTLGNTWVQALAIGPLSANSNLYIMYVANCNAGANTVTATGSGSGTFPQFVLAEYSGVAVSSPLDKTASATNSSGGTSFASGNTANTTVANELLIGIFGQPSGTTTTLTPGSGWTNEGQVRSGTVPDVAFFDQIVASIGAYGLTGTSSASIAWGAGIATFKAASVSTGIPGALTLLGCGAR
jgi:hypothetical protein